MAIDEIAGFFHSIFTTGDQVERVAWKFLPVQGQGRRIRQPLQHRFPRLPLNIKGDFAIGVLSNLLIDGLWDILVGRRSLDGVLDCRIRFCFRRRLSRHGHRCRAISSRRRHWYLWRTRRHVRHIDGNIRCWCRQFEFIGPGAAQRETGADGGQYQQNRLPTNVLGCCLASMVQLKTPDFFY